MLAMMKATTATTMVMRAKKTSPMESLHAQLFGAALVLFGVLLIGLKNAPDLRERFRLASYWTDSYAMAIIVLLFGVSMLAYGLFVRPPPLA